MCRIGKVQVNSASIFTARGLIFVIVIFPQVAAQSLSPDDSAIGNHLKNIKLLSFGCLKHYLMFIILSFTNGVRTNFYAWVLADVFTFCLKL